MDLLCSRKAQPPLLSETHAGTKTLDPSNTSSISQNSLKTDSKTKVIFSPASNVDQRSHPSSWLNNQIKTHSHTHTHELRQMAYRPASRLTATAAVRTGYSITQMSPVWSLFPPLVRQVVFSTSDKIGQICTATFERKCNKRHPAVLN